MLAAMFAPGSSRAPGILTDGAFFLDRDPEVFKVTFLFCLFYIMPLKCSIGILIRKKAKTIKSIT